MRADRVVCDLALVCSFKGAGVMIETMNGTTSTAEQTRQQSEQMLDKLFAAAQPGAVFAAPVVSGAYTMITASEIAAGGGFGFGSGTAPAPSSKPDSMDDHAASVAGGSGGGGGGGSTGRPVAAIVIGPDGVKVQPIFDWTKVALAGVAAWGAVAVMAVRLARKNQH
jgi:uncharacterized spore protein YtfJ